MAEKYESRQAATKRLVATIEDRYQTSDDVRMGLIDLLMRRVEAARFGTESLSLSDIREIAEIWETLNHGLVGAEVALGALNGARSED